jgi:hypothetical protein
VTDPRTSSTKDAALRFLAASGWPFEEPNGRTFARVLIEANAGRWPCIVQWNDEEDQLVVYSLCPHVVPADRRQAMGELVLRASFGLPIGAFELDLDDGELRFRTSIDFEDTVVDPVLVHHAFYINVALMDRHLPAIEAVLGGASAKEALARIAGP